MVVGRALVFTTSPVHRPVRTKREMTVAIGLQGGTLVHVIPGRSRPRGGF